MQSLYLSDCPANLVDLYVNGVGSLNEIDPDTGLEQFHSIVDLRPSPEDELIGRDLRETIHKRIDELPIDLKEIAKMRFIHGVSRRIAGKFMGLSVRTIVRREELIITRLRRAVLN